MSVYEKNMNSMSKQCGTPNSWSGVVNSLWIQHRNISNFWVVRQINIIVGNNIKIQWLSNWHLRWFNSDSTLKCQLAG